MNTVFTSTDGVSIDRISPTMFVLHGWNRDLRFDHSLVEHITTQGLDLLQDPYVLNTGENVTGQSLSYFRANLGVKRIPVESDFIALLEFCGFRVAPGRNRRGNHATVVTI